ncbi:MAG: SsrA-binding protein SmpB [bacterium]|nr:SsrA-binding protein SmpB [bacterium]
MKILNRRARFNYQIGESFEAGIALTGSEVKSIKMGRGDLSTAFVRLQSGEAWLINANIPQYSRNTDSVYDPLRSRKILLHKSELVDLASKQGGQKLTLIPLSLYTKGRLVKAQIAFAKGKKQFEKRDTLKARDIQREVEQALKDTRGR